MKLVIQRVKEAGVKVENITKAEIGKGLLVLIGIGKDDNDSAIDWLVNKVTNLRIYENKQGKMHYSVKDINGEILVIPQFTLYSNCNRGNRPDFTGAAAPRKAKELYHKFVETIKTSFPKIKTGVFAAHMEVSLINDGPVTIILEK